MIWITKQPAIDRKLGHLAQFSPREQQERVDRSILKERVVVIVG